MIIPLSIQIKRPLAPNLSCIVDHFNENTSLYGDTHLILHSKILWANTSTPEILKDISSKTDDKHKTLVFIVDDFEQRYNHHQNLILFRTSLRASRKRINEFVLPYIWECNDTAFPTSESTITPVVGFCGLVNKHRKKIIQTFKKSNRVESNFIIRDKFWGGDPHNSQLVDEYEANIKSSQFVLCNRGRGNFSMRFYQTLAFGRIPVLVNTDMVLPFENEIPWKDLIVFEKSEKKCLEKVIEIHKKDEITHRQKLCREFFDKFFHKDVVFSKLLESALKPQKTSWWSRLFA